MYMKWVTATEIDNWTVLEPRRAQETVPLLVWKLILASCKSVIDHHFPYGKAIQYPGYDGALDTDDESPFFPTGKSVWEIGTNEDVQNKFNTDLRRISEHYHSEAKMERVCELKGGSLNLSELNN